MTNPMMGHRYEKNTTYKRSLFWSFFHSNLCLCWAPYKSEVTQEEIELIGRVDGRTFDERKVEFEVGEGLNVNIPRSDLKFSVHSFAKVLSIFFLFTGGKSLKMML